MSLEREVMAKAKKKDFSLEDAIGLHERHAKGLLDMHIKEYGGYYHKEEDKDKAQEISDIVKGKFSAMMGYIGGNLDRLELNYKWADKRVKSGDISNEYQLFEFTKKFAKAIGHELGYVDLSTPDAKDKMRSNLFDLFARLGYDDKYAQEKIKELIDSNGVDDDAINLIKNALRAERSNDIMRQAFDRYDSNLTPDEAIQFSAALRAYEHESTDRKVRKDYLKMSTQKEDRLKEFAEMHNTLYHPETSLYGRAKDGERSIMGSFNPFKYQSEKKAANENDPKYRKAA